MTGEPRPAGILFDIDGVFFVGETPIPDAPGVVTWAASSGIPYLFVTNTTSHPRQYLVDKLARFGVDTTVDQILTPAVAARSFLGARADGPLALFVPDATAAEFDGFPIVGDRAETGAAAVVVGDLGARWDYITLNRAFRLLIADPPPVLVALGMTRYWRDTDGLNLDVGAFAQALSFASGITPVVSGKPAPEFYAAAVQQLGLAAPDVLMVGDDIRGDVQGAQRAGLSGALVRTGKFADSDLGLGIEPDLVLGTVAELPAWWSHGMGGGA